MPTSPDDDDFGQSGEPIEVIARLVQELKRWVAVIDELEVRNPLAAGLGAFNRRSLLLNADEYGLDWQSLRDASKAVLALDLPDLPDGYDPRVYAGELLELLTPGDKEVIDRKLSRLRQMIELACLPAVGKALSAIDRSASESVEADANEKTGNSDFDDALPLKERKLAPSRVKAKAAYEWAMSKILGAENMTIAELWHAIDCDPSNVSDWIGPNPEAFGKYLRDAGVKRYDTTGNRSSGSVRRRDEI